MLRSIQKAYNLIIEQDPETDITKNAIRIWCQEGKIKHLQAGNKILIDMDDLFNYIGFKKEN